MGVLPKAGSHVRQSKDMLCRPYPLGIASDVVPCFGCHVSIPASQTNLVSHTSALKINVMCLLNMLVSIFL